VFFCQRGLERSLERAHECLVGAAGSDLLGCQKAAAALDVERPGSGVAVGVSGLDGGGGAVRGDAPAGGAADGRPARYTRPPTV